MSRQLRALFAGCLLLIVLALVLPASAQAESCTDTAALLESEAMVAARDAAAATIQESLGVSAEDAERIAAHMTGYALGTAASTVVMDDVSEAAFEPSLPLVLIVLSQQDRPEDEQNQLFILQDLTAEDFNTMLGQLPSLDVFANALTQMGFAGDGLFNILPLSVTVAEAVDAAETPFAELTEPEQMAALSAAGIVDDDLPLAQGIASIQALPPDELTAMMEDMRLSDETLSAEQATVFLAAMLSKGFVSYSDVAEELAAIGLPEVESRAAGQELVDAMGRIARAAVQSVLTEECAN